MLKQHKIFYSFPFFPLPDPLRLRFYFSFRIVLLWKFQSSTITFGNSRQPGFVPNGQDIQGSYGWKTGEVLDQGPLQNLGFVGKVTCIPSRFAVDEYETAMSNMNQAPLPTQAPSPIEISIDVVVLTVCVCTVQSGWVWVCVVGLCWLCGVGFGSSFHGCCGGCGCGSNCCLLQ